MLMSGLVFACFFCDDPGFQTTKSRSYLFTVDPKLFVWSLRVAM